jgi:hypothetical protein
MTGAQIQKAQLTLPTLAWLVAPSVSHGLGFGHTQGRRDPWLTSLASAFDMQLQCSTHSLADDPG